MSGAHRGPGGDSIARSLGVLAGLVLVPAAVIAGLIWFFSTATDLEQSVTVLIPALASLVKALVEGKLDMVWGSVAVVTLYGWQVFSDVTHHPAGGLAGFLVRAAALICLGIGLVLLTRHLHLGRVWRAIRARLASGPGDGGPASPG